MTSKNQPVANSYMFEQFDLLVVEFEEHDISFQFWHVEREFNKDADRLANMALETILCDVGVRSICSERWMTVRMYLTSGPVHPHPLRRRGRGKVLDGIKIDLGLSGGYVTHNSCHFL